MIKLESVHIEEVRGIRKLDVEFGEATFAVSGPNGSGKSGVIDAIEFGLTGQIGRLMGRGTKGLTIGEHGPHVDKVKFPDAAFVQLKIFIPSLGKSATITRNLSQPRKPKIEPATAEVLKVLAEIEDHPEITLSRREILRFILVEPAKRSEEIQTILKLEQIGQTRSVLNTAQNKLQAQLKTADALVTTRRETLLRHLQIGALKADDVLAAVNTRRKTLGLGAIAKLESDTKLDAELADAGKAPEFNKQSILRDLKAVTAAVAGLPVAAKASVTAILGVIAKIEGDPALLESLNRRALVEKGLDLVDGPECPLCDHPWADEAHLREHLNAKLAKSAEAGKLQEALLKAAGELGREATRLNAHLASMQKIAAAEADQPAVTAIDAWVKNLEKLKAQLGSFDGIMGLKARLNADWASTPATFGKRLETLTKAVEAKPDQSAAADARTFLTTAQLRLDDLREARRQQTAAAAASKTAKATYDTYCKVMETELNALYEDVQEDFSTFYKTINEGDEVTFTAKLTPSAGKLDFDVNFYERGLFPPAAFHSEGHQDGMGVCLYLALMKRLFGDQFTLALLDDVVMSVDTDHRKQFCKLLKTAFPNTQFIITTHDRAWAQQMKSAGLVTKRTSLAFHSWSVDTGPLVESNDEIWDDIAAALAKGKAEDAAGSLRRHLEYVSRQLADELGASVVFKADGNYELGELLPAVVGRLRELCGKAAAAAQSWGNAAAQKSAVELKDRLSAATGVSNVEQWAINQAVHYNEWANFGKKDFEPVVAAFKELINCFRCAECQSWLYVTPHGIPESMRCTCSAVTMNLNAKPK